jgi:hypothetical protein
MTKDSEIKAAFRRTKIWKDFRKKMKEKQNGIDPITGTKLTKTANLHHRYFVDSDHYTDLSDEDDFIFINKQTHDNVHWILRYIKKYGDLRVLDTFYDEIVSEAIRNDFIDYDKI